MLNQLATQGGNGAVVAQFGTTTRFVAVGNNILCNGGTGTTGIISGASSSGGKVGGNLITGCVTAQTLGGTSISTTF